MYRDEADLELLAELAGVLDRTVTDAGLGPGAYLVLRQLASTEEPQPITGLAEQLSATPDEVVAQAERLMGGGLAEASGRGLSATASGRSAVADLEERANADMLAYVLERPHTATVYGLVAAMQSGRFTVEDLLAFLAEDEDEDEAGAGGDVAPPGAPGA